MTNVSNPEIGEGVPRFVPITQTEDEANLIDHITWSWGLPDDLSPGQKVDSIIELNQQLDLTAFESRNLSVHEERTRGDSSTEQLWLPDIRGLEFKTIMGIDLPEQKQAFLAISGLIAIVHPVRMAACYGNSQSAASTRIAVPPHMAK